ncbi:hypothetical protein D3C71_1597680 [compost metagenome]
MPVSAIMSASEYGLLPVGAIMPRRFPYIHSHQEGDSSLLKKSSSIFCSASRTRDCPSASRFKLSSSISATRNSLYWSTFSS